MLLMALRPLGGVYASLRKSTEGLRKCLRKSTEVYGGLRKSTQGLRKLPGPNLANFSKIPKFIRKIIFSSFFMFLLIYSCSARKTH